jgi:NTP pyrophosphatase (non-canonical NTP hydrolase)
MAELFQHRVAAWMHVCFGEEISADRQERNHRFLEEALELVQACGATKAEALALVDYVYGRPKGEPAQEVGGVLVTLAAHCEAHGIDMENSGETELARVWTKVEQIRAKQAAKPKGSPLPGKTPGGAIPDLMPGFEPKGPIAAAEEILNSLGFVGKIPPSTIATCAAELIAEHYARPPFSIAADCNATIIDGDGRPVLTVDVNRERDDRNAAVVTGLLLAILDSLCVQTTEASHG